MVTDAAGQVVEVMHVPNRARKGKTGGRTMPLHPDLQAALMALQTAREARATPERPILFSERGGGVSPATVRLWFHRLSPSRKMDGCSSHSGRRTFMTRAARTVSPVGGIRMKLSADSLHEDESFALVLQTVTEDLRRGPSFAHRLGRQTFGSLTGLLQEVVQFACRLKDGLEPARSQRLEMSGEFQETQLALVLQPQGRPRLRTQRIIQQNAEHPSIQIT